MVDDLRLRFDLRGVVEGDAGRREQQHSDQAHRRTDPVPLVQRAQPEASTLLAAGNIRGGGATRQAVVPESGEQALLQHR